MIRTERAKYEKAVNVAKATYDRIVTRENSRIAKIEKEQAAVLEKARAHRQTVIQDAATELQAAAQALKLFVTEGKQALGDNNLNGSTPRKASTTDGVKTKRTTTKTTARAKTKTGGRKPGPVSAGTRRAQQGRREVLEGKRPPIKDAIKTILGDKTMSSTDIFEALKKRGWLPNSNNPRAYTSYVLSSNKEHFESVRGLGRGFYRVIGGTSKGSSTAKKTTTAKKKSTAAAASAPAKAGAKKGGRPKATQTKKSETTAPAETKAESTTETTTPETPPPSTDVATSDELLTKALDGFEQQATT